MTFVKYALLGGVALAAVTISAKAESLDDLKAQIEALNARLALLETSPSVPAGYDLMTFAKAPRIMAPGEVLRPNDTAMPKTFTILPTADVVDGGEPGLPSSAQAQWTGHVKTALVYEAVELLGTITDDATHIVSNTELNLKAINDTAVGEVGVHVRFSAEADGRSTTGGGMDRFYGWWKMAPELTLKAGFKDSIGGVGHGNDKCTCNFTTFAGVVGGSEDDSTQIELRYSSGPIEAAIALEHADYKDNVDDYATDVVGAGQTYLVAGEVKWSGDSVSAEISGFWGEKPADTAATEVLLPPAPPTYTGDVDTLYDTTVDIWQIGAGLSFGLDAFSVSAAAGLGEVDGFGYWEASLFSSVSLSDSVSAELGAGYEDYQDLVVTGVAGGLYWSPVDKLTLGAEAAWTNAEVSGTTLIEAVTADLVTVFKF